MVCGDDLMPIKLERKLKKIAAKRGYGKERTGRYVYGTLGKIKDVKNAR
ncbi:hypothetical protein LCGC14_1242310 [marine sediment metagenome]|uniref:Uncharacterized protein n=1 Tax=marine sediment metagenome TaxID=412755 RepID=A0A0F9NML4_9ZZZZ